MTELSYDKDSRQTLLVSVAVMTKTLDKLIGVCGRDDRITTKTVDKPYWCLWP